jgi:hypothetical protein
MQEHLENTIALLERTPGALDALLRGLPKMWTENGEGEKADGEKTWSARMVVAHLVHCEHEDWMPRARMILERGEQQAFDPLDREGSVRAGAGKTLEALLDEFVRARAKSLEELRGLHLTPADFERRGRHPAFGPVTLSQLLATWAAHDLTHLHQISRIMAHQYREAVGPWSRFLGVMQCKGHSE